MARDDDGGLALDNTDRGYSRRRGGVIDMHTVRSRDKQRKQMATDVERFLKSGGRIEHLPSHATGEHIGVVAEL